MVCVMMRSLDMNVKRIVIGTLLILALSLGATFVLAVDQPEPDDASNSLNMLPMRVQLDGMQRVLQDFNRCSAAALTIQLSYWRSDVSYTGTIDGLNPHSDDVSVRLEEMITYADQFGLKAVERTGGTLDQIKALVANGFPVLIENVYYDGADVMLDWMSHNKVVTGYDDELQVIYTYDPLLGFGPDEQGRPVPYDSLDNIWRPLNRGYLVIYEPQDEAKVAEIMGDQWDVNYNVEWTYDMVQADLASANSDTFDLFNLGTALVNLGRYEEAADAFDRARQIGLPMRMMWYQFGPFQAYLELGRYDDVINLARNTLINADGIEEVYYYVAQAYLGLGNPAQAEANLEVALWRNANFTAAQDLLIEMRRVDTGA